MKERERKGEGKRKRERDILRRRSVACAKGGRDVECGGTKRGDDERSHYDAEEPIFWAAWRDATRYAAMLRDYHNNRRYYSVAGFAVGADTVCR